jgi:carboxymethylenebutenolidase
MRPVRFAIALLILSTLIACKDDEPARTASSPTATTTSTAASASASAPQPEVPTGVLSEEDFKALHLLKPEQAPPPKGSDLELSGGSTAYLSLPKDRKPPLPGIVVVHEWWGLNEHIKHWTDRLAEDGYAAIAVDLYGGKIAREPDEAMKLMKAVDSDAAKKTLLQAFELLAKDERIGAKKRGVIGWCFGGKWSLELALAAPDLDAAVVYYGHVTTSPERLASLQASLLAIFGNQDEGIPPKMVTEFEFGLEQAGGKDYKLLRYDAKHAFANPSSGHYDEKSAADAWKQVRGFLAKKLK